MTDKKALAQKKKRILLYFEILLNYGLSMDVTLKFMSYVFSLTENYMYKEIISKCDINDFKTVKLDHWDLDKKLIDGFIKKQFKINK